MNKKTYSKYFQEISKLSPLSTKTPTLLYPIIDEYLTPKASPSPIIQNTFNDFLDGKINKIQLIQANNYPRLHIQKEIEKAEKLQRERESKGMVLLGPLLRFKHKFKHVKTNSEERAIYLQTKLAQLNCLIKSKVVDRKKDNDEKRRKSLQNVGLLKSIVEASENINKKLEQPNFIEKQIPQTKSLKTVTISYDDQKIARKQFLKQKYKSLSSTNPKLFLKTQLLDSSKQFLKELQQINEKKQEHLNKLSKMKLLSDNKLENNQKFDLFVKGVLTQKDIELYDYIHTKTENVQYDGHLIDKYDDQEINIIDKLKALKLKNKKQKQLSIGQTITKEIIDVSDNSSLQSAYEIHLDNLYGQTREMKKLLQKKTTLPKRIKQMIRLDELGRQTLYTSDYKLSH